MILDFQQSNDIKLKHHVVKLMGGNSTMYYSIFRNDNNDNETVFRFIQT